MTDWLVLDDCADTWLVLDETAEDWLLLTCDLESNPTLAATLFVAAAGVFVAGWSAVQSFHGGRVTARMCPES